jgi:hypothetical protein
MGPRTADGVSERAQAEPPERQTSLPNDRRSLSNHNVLALTFVDWRLTTDWRLTMKAGV